MPANSAHLSDEILLHFSDQELSSRRSLKARMHLAQCERCRGRLGELENTSAAFTDIYEKKIQAQQPDSSGSRNLLRARLTASSSHRNRSHRPIFGSTWAQQLAGACLMLLMVVAGLWMVRDRVGKRYPLDAGQADAVALPRRMLTPGSTRAIQISDVCGNQNINNDPPVNPDLKRAVFNEYGVSSSSKMNYELDYLITPSLGGTGNIQNLWPEPSATAWNAQAKDQLEDHLHDLVCQGKIQLTTAQHDMASDWIAAYKRYFNTDRPEPTPSSHSARLHSQRVLDTAFEY